MITEAVTVALLFVVEFVVGLLPDDPVSWPSAAGLGEDLGAYAGPLNKVLPLVEFVTMVTVTVTVVLPALIVYKTVMWLWGVVPKPGGGT